MANSFTLSLAHCIVCSITAGNDFSVQWGTSSSGGSRLKRDTQKMITNNNKKINNSFYYINTNEIPGELSRENLISSHAKKHVRKYHRCYGYIINRAFHTKTLLKWNGLVFHWCLYNKNNVSKKYFTSERSERVKYFSTLEEKFRMSARLCNIFYVFLGETPYGRLMSASYIHSEGPVSSSALNTIRFCFLVVPSSSPRPSL